MKKSPHLKSVGLAGLMLAAGIAASQASTSFVVSSFDNAASITGFGAWQTWNGSAGTASWAAGPAFDAGSSSSSGSLELQINYDGGTGQGGAVVLNIAKDASAFNALEWDAMVGPGAPVDKYGNCCDIKVGVQTTSSYHYHATDQNLTPGGWKHFKVNASDLGGTEWNQIVQVFIQCFDNNYTNAVTTTLYVDNIQFTGPDATFPNFTSDEFQFNTNVWSPDNGTFWNAGQGNIAHRFGDATVWNWSPNDAHGNASSGSLYIESQIDGAPSPQNSLILDIPFSTNWLVYGLPTTNGVGVTNFINGHQYTNIEFDVLWDATNSTISLADFNTIGDVTGFPMAILSNNGTNNNWNEVEACGTAAPNIPDGGGTNGPNASNTWVHMSVPLNNTAAGIDQVNGIFLKKYNNSQTIAHGNPDGSANPLVAAFFIDNITFDGAVKTPPVPTMTISKATPGLQLVTVAGPYGPYERENLGTTTTSYNFVDSPSPWTYSFTIGAFAPVAQTTSAEIGFVPVSSGVAGTEAEWDYNDPTVLRIDVQRTATGSSAVIRYKYNSPAGNGTLFGGNPTFNTASPIEGTWSFTFTQNTNILCVAPDGSSTNLAYPNVTNSTDVSTQMAGGLFVFFGAIEGGSAGAGARFVLNDVSIKNGGSTVLSDNFLTDTSIDLNKWNVIPDSGTGTVDLYLLGADTKYFIDWSTIGGPGWQVTTNTTLGTPFGYSASLTSESQLNGGYYHTEVATTNLPATGNLFFGLRHSN
ncbi:MAG TPA: hypothetical protein VHB20_14920 [Verrucomicrobiae bacterium]|jgi:hypothetical protein|nr:hypothetical protein [Verrucomicrobiae bacterium]